MHSKRTPRGRQQSIWTERRQGEARPRVPWRREPAILALLLVILAAPLAAYAAPRAVIVQPLHVDRGEVEPDQIQKLEWTLRNEGDETLTIDALEPTCYCVTARPDSWKIPAGGSTTIRVTVDPSDFVGKVRKGFVLLTNDPKAGQIETVIDILIRPGIAVVPPELDFGEVPAAGSPERTVDLKSPTSRPFVVKSVSTGLPFLSVEQEPLQLEERSGVRLYVQVKPGAPAGAFTGAVVVQTDDAAKPRIEIPVRGVGPGGLHAEPERLVFESAAPGTDVGTIAVLGGKGIEVTGVRASTPQVEATLQTQADGSYRVHVKVASSAKTGRLLAKLFVTTSDTTQPELTVPVMGFVR